MSVQALKDYIEENKQIWSSPIHGINHWEHVWSNGQQVGWAVDADLEVVEYFAYLHDCQRWSEGTDWLHGPRAAQFAQQNRELFDLSGSQFKELISAVAGHTKLQPGCKAGENPTIATCWDADRLDIWRVGYSVDTRYLFTDRAKDLAELMPDGRCMTMDEVFEMRNIPVDW